MSATTAITVSRELRPARVALLVVPNDPGTVREALGWATACWGGVHWPLVPVLETRPRWWGPAPDGSFPDRDAIVCGYLKTYDPDWIVSFAEGYTPPIMQERVVALDRWGLRARGCVRAADPLDAVVEDLFERRFRFRERDAPEHVFHEAHGPLLGDVLLGRLGRHPVQDALAARLRVRLGAKPAALDPDLLVRTQRHVADKPELITPLQLGTEEFLFRRPSRQWSYVYFCSLRRPWDAIELWSLRAAALDVLAIPLEWADVLALPLAEALDGGDVLALAARPLTRRQWDRAAQLIGGRLVPLVDPPVCWGRDPLPSHRPARLVAAHDVTAVSVTGGRVELESLAPRWAGQGWPVQAGGWFNEFELHGDPDAGERATCCRSTCDRQARCCPPSGGHQARACATGALWPRSRAATRRSRSPFPPASPCGGPG